MFGYRDIREADALILMVFLTSVLIPLIAILVMKGIGWVRSMQMSDQHERIGPYLVTAVLYLSLYLHLAKTKSFPPLILVITLGSVIALFLGFFVNNFRKISMHGISIGGFLLALFLLYSRYSTDHFELPFSGLYDAPIPTIYLLYLAILAAGLVCSSRLILRKHTPTEVYSGLVVGFISMTLAYALLG
jgi:membrane-associated phospholipid phosphatase